MSSRAPVGLVFLIAIVCGASPARADVDPVFLPESRHHQTLSYGLFHDLQTSFFLRQSGKALGAIGGGVALLEAQGWSGKPQLVAFAMVQSTNRLNSQDAGLLTDTIDAYGGMVVDWFFGQSSRLSFGWEHLSGHASDDIPYPELIGPNLGDDMLYVRFVRDEGEYFRFGITLKPLVGSDPTNNRFWADQFFEFFPWGAREGDGDGPAVGTPYVAAGFEEHGRDQLRLDSNAQAGVYFGSHVNAKHRVSARGLVGIYSGADPALKLDQFKGIRSTFLYGGVAFGF